MGANDQAPADTGGGATPVDTSTSSSASAETSASADSTPEISADTFGWDSWDGSEDALPEAIRPWVSKAGGYYTKQSELAKQEAERVRQIYESLMEGREDPRLTEYEQKLEEYTEARTKLEQERDQYRSQYEQTIAEYQRQAEAQATAKVEAFQKANSWIFENPELQKLGLELLNEDFEDTDLPVLLRMPEDLLKIARSIHKELRSTGAKNVSAHAMELARARHKPAKPNPAARMTAGANGSVATSVAPKPLELADDMKAWKDRAIDRALTRAK